MTSFLDFDIIRWLMGEDQLHRERRGDAPRGPQEAPPLGPGARRVPFVGQVMMSQGMHTVRATSGDISEGGAFIRTTNPPGVGCEVMLTIRLDQTLSLVTTAQVRWVGIDDAYHPTGCGVSFEPLSDATRAAVREVLDEAEAREAASKKPQKKPASDSLWHSHGFLDRIAG